MSKYDFSKLRSNFIEIKLWHGYSPVNLLHIFRTPFHNNTYGGIPLNCTINLCPSFFPIQKDYFLSNIEKSKLLQTSKYELALLSKLKKRL